MYSDLLRFHSRPAPFSVHTIDLLWTDPHVARQMLRYHLDPESDLASRRPRSIDSMVGWIDRRFQLEGKAVCDLGCGPGLYATRMAERGADVTGIDFSQTSIDHARSVAGERGLSIDYRQSDYLTERLPEQQDIVMLIYCDLCPLSPDRRRELYRQVRFSLKAGGRFVFDVFSVQQFEQLAESDSYGRRFMDGFWAPGDYFGFLKTFLYPDRKVGLDRYLIVEPDRTREIFNWMQYFDTDSIAAELAENGFVVTDVLDDLTGEAWRPGQKSFAVVAELAA